MSWQNIFLYKNDEMTHNSLQTLDRKLKTGQQISTQKQGLVLSAPKRRADPGQMV